MSDPRTVATARKLHIGLDFDDTLMPTREALVALLNKLHATDVRIEDCEDYYLFQPWQLSETEFQAMFNAHEDHIHAQAPLEGMIETLGDWSPHAQFTVVTGRPECWVPSASAWLKRYNIPFTDIISAKAAGGKGVVARKLGIDFFVEDHVAFAKEIADADVPVFLLDRLYNKSLVHPLITRVKDWHEIRESAVKRFQLSPQSHRVTEGAQR